MNCIINGDIFAARYKNNEFIYLLGNSNISSMYIHVYYGDGYFGQTVKYTGNTINAIDAT